VRHLRARAGCEARWLSAGQGEPSHVPSPGYRDPRAIGRAGRGLVGEDPHPPQFVPDLPDSAFSKHTRSHAQRTLLPCPHHAHLHVGVGVLPPRGGEGRT
jgi:hypothetical protein